MVNVAKKEAWNKKRLAYWERRKRRRQQIRLYAKDILESHNFRRCRAFIQHGDVSVRKHCLRVAECSISLEEKLKRLGISCRVRETVRGALLHDYFLYDWHKPEGRPIPKLHGFFHPGIALRNAAKEYRLTKRERDIIKKHMWPLTVIPPTCREAWVVTLADKYCSLQETLRGKRERHA